MLIGFSLTGGVGRGGWAFLTGDGVDLPGGVSGGGGGGLPRYGTGFRCGVDEGGLEHVGGGGGAPEWFGVE